jgi:enoyl-CoA hydratase/carnithine racemase
MALFCDYRIMSRGPYKIGLNETRVGLTLPDFIHAALVRLVGDHRAERLIVSGALLSPEQALHAGFVDELSEDPAAAVNSARQWCETLLDLPPRTMAANRRIMRASLTSLFDRSPEGDHEAFLDVWFSDETRATLKALVESLKKK